ncbi:probable serine/threonine-protein kinase clkA isoform X2 [Lucilia cuprina]|uniref:probable serine/threonine-protein kinase clkA isoform X2 n=1 Tax=Lucilia cuprina TaxID=7375 RepID=UPI001F059347|nr:probable serine/threonine-protein kinase clkA isoform X2 [Lucilia cuprina]
MSKMKKKSCLIFQMILFIMCVNIRLSQAQVLDSSINHLIRNQRPDDNVVIGDNIRNRYQENARTTLHTNGRNNIYYSNNNGNSGYEGQVQRRNQMETDDKNEENRKISSQHNIISGNNIRNRVQINGQTIEEGQIDDEGSKRNNHNISHDHRDGGKRNQDRLYTHNNHNIDHDHRDNGRGNQDRLYTHNNNNVISGNNIRNRVQINGQTIEEGQIGDHISNGNNPNNGRNRLQANAKTIEKNTIGDKQSNKQQPKENIVTTIEEPSLWQRIKNWFG